MPTADQLTGFILKKEACATYDRSFRQLARDFDKAAARGDKAFLENFKLHLEDGTIMEASEVTKDKIQKLRDKGLNPTWYVRESWMNDKYGRRDDKADVSTTTADQRADVETAKPSSSPIAPDSAIIQSKDDLIDVLRDENKYLRESLAKETEQRGEVTQLTRELHLLLKNMQDRLLPAPNSTESRGPVHPARQATATVVETVEASPASPRSKTKRKQPAKKAASTKPKWYEMPTLKKFFHS